MDRLHARRTAGATPVAGFIVEPAPRSIGDPARGRDLLAGRFVLGGRCVEAPGRSPWDIDTSDADFSAALHGFGWLDDLAALGDGPACRTAQAWTAQWLARYGRGRGPGWTPAVAGRRLLRWLFHASLLLSDRPDDETEPLFAALAHHTAFLTRRWRRAPPGAARFEALVALLHAGIMLEGMESHLASARIALGAECAERIGPDGAISGRNPEELLDILTLLSWASSALSEAGKMADRDHVAAIERIAPTLRSLRHADGALARFHGGGPGAPGRLDRALAESGVRVAARDKGAMGFARITAGRSSLIADAAAPPAGRSAAHASTLAFELTSGRRPVIVSCGAAALQGREWRRAARATALHSTLAVEGMASSRLRPGRALARPGPVPLAIRPEAVTLERFDEPYGRALLMSHDGYAPGHGLTHVRRLDLSADGRALMGEDTLGAITPDHRARFDRFMADNWRQGARFCVRFHLHPDVTASLDKGGASVLLTLASGERWRFRHDGAAMLSLEPSVYFDESRPRPRATSQIVLSGVVVEYAAQANWTLAKTGETPVAVRDIEMDAPAPAGQAD